MTKEELQKQYNIFANNWQRVHSISKAPSFTSWKQTYRSKKIILREEITTNPTKKEIELMEQYGQDINNKCLDCGKPLYYFNQCDDCYSKMIAEAKA